MCPRPVLQWCPGQHHLDGPSVGTEGPWVHPVGQLVRGLQGSCLCDWSLGPCLVRCQDLSLLCSSVLGRSTGRLQLLLFLSRRGVGLGEQCLQGSSGRPRGCAPEESPSYSGSKLSLIAEDPR